MKFLVIMSFLLTQSLWATEINIKSQNILTSSGGFLLVDSPIIVTGLSGEYKKIYFFVNDYHNQISGKSNRIYAGVKSPVLDLTEKTKLRVGLTRLQYLENGGKNDLLSASLSNNTLTPLNMDLSLKLTKLIDDNYGERYILGLKKGFSLRSTEKYELFFTPKANITYMNSFFRITGHATNMYSTELKISSDKNSFSLFWKRFVGYELPSSTEYGFSLSYIF